MAESSGIWKPDQHLCASCGKKNLPEPIEFAQLSRLTNKYVCAPCYIKHSIVLSKTEVKRGQDQKTS
jgi:hypothetical protein